MDTIQKRLLETIRARFRRGDINEVVKKTGFSRRYVSDCLNPDKEEYSESVIASAEAVIKERKESMKQRLKSIKQL